MNPLLSEFKAPKSIYVCTHNAAISSLLQTVAIAAFTSCFALAAHCLLWRHAAAVEAASQFMNIPLSVYETSDHIMLPVFSYVTYIREHIISHISCSTDSFKMYNIVILIYLAE